ncbi:cupin domain-containing protein [Citrobacter sp. BDA59-3]|uniref:cupin domain-containing protein n=1 Tax=Citrobacter sp. BDA59-3 TaxID=2781952 RepID=UPI0018813BD0|nr:cupin domain-containing protein [Citrobacter sp. BDA59-3]QOV67913.1 cupin domain-containing protein [Citrobacter sp. BDA59-3]
MVTQHNSSFSLGKRPLSFRLLAVIAATGAALLPGGHFVHSVYHPGASTPDIHYSDRHSQNMQMSGMPGPMEVARPETSIRPVSCEPLPGIPGKSLTVAVIDFPPDAYTPSHRHPGSVSAFVLKGTLRSQMEGSAAETYKAGQTWFEPPGALHLFAENVSKSQPAELLATFITDSHCGPLVIPA